MDIQNQVSTATPSTEVAPTVVLFPSNSSIAVAPALPPSKLISSESSPVKLVFMVDHLTH